MGHVTDVLCREAYTNPEHVCVDRSGEPLKFDDAACFFEEVARLRDRAARLTGAPLNGELADCASDIFDRVAGVAEQLSALAAARD